MRFSLATVATAALVLSASAAPHRGIGKGRNTDAEEQDGKGAGRGRYPEGTFPSGAFGSQGAAAPTGAFPGFAGKPFGSSLTAAPTALPTGGLDLSTISFELPSSATGKFTGFVKARADDSESSSSSDSQGDSSDSSGSSESSDSSNSSEESTDKEESSSDSKASQGDDSTSGDSTSGDSSSGDKETSSGSGDEESSSGSGDDQSSSDTDSGSGTSDDTSSGSGDEESSSGSGDETSSGSGDETSSGSGDETSSGSGDEETSSGSGDETSSGSGDETSSGSGDEESSSGSGNSDDKESSSGSDSSSGSPSVPSSGSSNSTSGGDKATGTFPTAAGESTLSEPMEVTDFDGGMVKFGRGVPCTPGEGGGKDAVFHVADGGTLSNVIIGADQIEGVHCAGACTITNVWWEAVCEDALTFKGNGDGTVSGGGAKGAKDKVVQHNGVGSISISGFYVEDFGKLYRSCGNCKEQGERHVKLDGIKAVGGTATFVGINSNFGDTATITNSCVTGTDVICQEFEGTSPGNEPKKISDGPSASCIYTEADVNAC